MEQLAEQMGREIREGESEGDGRGVSGWEGMRLWFSGLFSFNNTVTKETRFHSKATYMPVLV